MVKRLGRKQLQRVARPVEVVSGQTPPCERPRMSSVMCSFLVWVTVVQQRFRCMTRWPVLLVQ